MGRTKSLENDNSRLWSWWLTCEDFDLRPHYELLKRRMLIPFPIDVEAEVCLAGWCGSQSPRRLQGECWMCSSRWSWALHNVSQLLHGLLVDGALLGAILPYKEKLAESSKEFIWQVLQLGADLFPTTESGCYQQLPSGDNLKHQDFHQTDSFQLSILLCILSMT